MKIKILKQTFVKGQLAEVGEVIEATQTDGEYLIGIKKAELTNNETKKNIEPKENKSIGLKKSSKFKKLFKK